MRRLAPLAVAVAVLAIPGTALASWGSGGNGGAASKAVVMPSGSAPTVSVVGRNVTVSWSASTLPGGTAVNAYRIARYDASLASQTVGSACSGNVAALTCTEASVPAGTWTYTVTPKQASWLGTESARSAGVSVAAAAFSITSGSPVASLPGSVAGNLSGFATGESVTFRLDDPSSGAVLSGSTVPASFAAAGTATASVTIPNGTSAGTHQVYAVGSGGTTANASITVNDTTPPTVGAAAIGPSTGGTTGWLKQGIGYYVYANVTDPSPGSGVASVTANVGAITTGATAVPLTATGGPFTVGGVTYAYRSAVQTANAVLAPGAVAFSIHATDTSSNATTQGGFSVTIDNVPPFATDVQTSNGGGTLGTAEAGDAITFTFSEAIDPTTMLPAWSGSGTPVTVRFVNNGVNDQLEVWNGANTTQLPLGTVALGANHVNGQGATFSGSTMSMSGSTITVVLGTQAGTTRSTSGGSMVWTPSTTPTDRAGNACLATPALESGVLDTDF